VLSWEDVAADLAEAEGSMNVVLHEFTHQLDAETGEMNGLPRIADASLRTDWAAVMSSAYALHVRLVEAERPTLLDPYGAEDPAEFFAVSVEAFFQQPLRVRSGLPALYRLLARYFSQDPAAWADAH
jgi:Mlc titration factor MtfA (ptsG expression regulator)